MVIEQISWNEGDLDLNTALLATDYLYDLKPPFPLPRLLFPDL